MHMAKRYLNICINTKILHNYRDIDSFVPIEYLCCTDMDTDTTRTQARTQGYGNF